MYELPPVWAKIALMLLGSVRTAARPTTVDPATVSEPAVPLLSVSTEGVPPAY